jgi:uncharacterized low-complexity protein
MTKKNQKLSVFALALIAGFFLSFIATDVKANQLFNDAESITISSEIEAPIISSIYDNETSEKCGEGKCGEGKCGSATKESKKEGKKDVKTEKNEGKVKTSESKCGEGKCGGAEKKEGKAEKKEGTVEKKEGKTEKKSEGKCGEGKCGTA